MGAISAGGCHFGGCSTGFNGLGRRRVFGLRVSGGNSPDPGAGVDRLAESVSDGRCDCGLANPAWLAKVVNWQEVRVRGWTQDIEVAGTRFGHDLRSEVVRAKTW